MRNRIFFNLVASIFFTTFLYTCALAQDTTSVRKKGSWVALPVVTVMPETGLSFGALGMRLFKFNYKDTLIRTSNVQAVAIYTLNNQLLLGNNYSLFFNKEKYITFGVIEYQQFPEYFYGIGNNPVSSENREQIDYTFFRFENRFLRKVKGRFFAGTRVRFLEISNISFPVGGLVDNLNPLGENGTTAFGLGIDVMYDSRDNVVNPHKGEYLEFSTLSHGLFGNAFYDLISIDARKFIPIIPRKEHILALQFFGNFIVGTPHLVRQYAELGNDNVMRGYYRGRFRNNHLMAFQAEYRFPVWRFVGMTVFAGAASLTNSFPNFNDIFPNFGAGLRIRVNRKDKVNVRVDYGFGRQTSDLYLNLGEAF